MEKEKQYMSFEQDGQTYNLYDMPDGFVIKGDLDLSDRGLKKLPDLSKITVLGCVNVSGNQITDLNGLPQKIGDDLWCDDNDRLNSLVGVHEVNGSIFCDINIGEKYGVGFINAYPMDVPYEMEDGYFTYVEEFVETDLYDIPGCELKKSPVYQKELKKKIANQKKKHLLMSNKLQYRKNKEKNDVYSNKSKNLVKNMANLMSKSMMD